MKDAFDVLRDMMAKANEDGFAERYLNEHTPNGNHDHMLIVECNGGVYFLNYKRGFETREITASEFMNLVYEDWENG